MTAQHLLSLSDLRVIGPVQINRQAQLAEWMIEDYCERLGIKLPHFQEYTTMSSYLYPSASLERLVAIDILTNLLYYTDDLFSSARADPDDADDIAMWKVFENCILILRYGIMPKESLPLYATSMKLRELMLRLASDAWLSRLATSLENHFKSTTLSLQSIMQDGILDVGRYIAVREHDSGMYPTIDLLELGSDIYLPDEVLNHPVVQILRECTIRLGGLMNDLFSYHKEVILQGQRFNLVNVLMESKGWCFEETVHKVVLMLNGYTETFLNYEQCLPTYPNEDTNQKLQIYVQGLRDQIIATYHWQMATNRYRSPESPFPELRTILKS